MSREMLMSALREQGGMLWELAQGSSGAEEPRDGPAQVAARGPRARGHEREYELLLELILEGWRLHYRRPEIVGAEDPDVALLLGDQLYALGLERLTALGDLEAIAELADVISLTAQAEAGCDLELADAIWRAGAVAIGWGSTDTHRAAKRLAEGEDPAALGALRAASEPL